MTARLAVDSGNGPRQVDLDAYLDAAAEERAQIDARQWIKGLRHLQVDGQPLRARFTIRGDSLWWFTEIYLHKERAVLSIMRTIAAFDALVERERPLHIRWAGGDATTAYVVRQRAAFRRIRFDGPRRGAMAARARLAALRARAAMLHLAGLLPVPAASPAAGAAPIVAFVHRAFVDESSGPAAGERYIGRVLEQLDSRGGRGSLRCVMVGPRRNFRARRWWDPLVGRDRSVADRVERFARGRRLAGARMAWRERHRSFGALERSEAVRRHAVIQGIDCWPVIREQLAGVVWLQWPWSARAMDQAGGALDALRPTACVTYAEAGGWGRAIALECRRRAIPLAGLQHGFIYRHWLNYLHEADEVAPDPANPADRGFPRPELTLVFDAHAARHLVEAGHFPRDAVRVTGSPLRDDLVGTVSRLDAAEIAAARRAAGARDDQALVVLAAKFTEAADLLPQLVAAVREAPGLHLAIKPHPADAPAAYGAASSAPNVTVLPGSTPLAPLLAAAKAVVTVNSTVAIDALALGVPALVMGLPNNLTPFVEAGAMLGARDLRELARGLARLTTDEALRARLIETGRALTEAPAGSAAQASADTILGLAVRASERSRTSEDAS